MWIFQSAMELIARAVVSTVHEEITWINSRAAELVLVLSYGELRQEKVLVAMPQCDPQGC